MNKSLPCFLFFLLFAMQSFAFPYNPQVAKDVWGTVTPYFLPEDHPVKGKLDKLFSKGRITQNKATLLQAKFKHLKESPWSHVVCAKHDKLHGYVIKLYLDDTKGVTDWAQWIARITGADAIREALKRHHGYNELFKVAHKWIYPLPSTPSPLPGVKRHNFILVAEDMHVHRRKDSLRKWRGIAVNKRKLTALFTLLKELGLSDSVYPFNLPFSKDGRIVFIDTEKHHQWPLHYEKLLPYLSPRMQLHWQHLIQTKG